MWSLLDHLNALVLVPAVVLLFLATQMGGQEAQIAATVQASGLGVYETADWIERDLANLGAADGEAALVDFVWDETGQRFTFRTAADTTLDAPSRLVRYELAEGADAQHVELRRYAVGPGADTLTARSPATLRTATVALLDEDGAAVPPGELDRARAVEVRLTMDPPLGSAEEPTTWHRRLAPRHLARDG